ncbi:MAG TPA: TlpA disulfide reductase family protein [Ktedonobacteraceae bacterium]|nr:TlpA disulfide reductase family protein [Ktedonobacteraceae bacterium]
MSRQLSKTKEQAKQEQQLARTQRQELKAELAEHYAERPRAPRNRRRTITFVVLGIIAVLAGIFAFLVLLPSPTQQPTGGVPVGTAAPGFVLPIYGGSGSGSIDLRALRGHPVVINFWSESCTPCRSEMPFLEHTYTQLHGAFVLLGVDQADPKDDIASFGKTFQITYPLLFDPGDKTNIAYGVTAIPTTYFIDSNGIVRSVFVEQLTTKTLQQGLASIGVHVA